MLLIEDRFMLVCILNLNSSKNKVDMCVCIERVIDLDICFYALHLVKNRQSMKILVTTYVYDIFSNFEF